MDWYIDEKALSTIFNIIKSVLNSKVDKVSGKVLSSNDFTTELKDKLNNLEIYALPVATNNELGGIKVGNGLEIDSSGVLSVSEGTGGNTSEGITIDDLGEGLTIDRRGKLIIDTETIPIASDKEAGAIILGIGLSVDKNGVVSVTSVEWDNILNKPNILTAEDLHPVTNEEIDTIFS